MQAAIESGLLGEARIEEAGGVLARAFFDGPLFVYAQPDDATRLATGPGFFSAGARYGHLFGEVHASSGAVEGAAVWLTPGATDLPDEQLAQTGFPHAMKAMGEDAVAHLLGVMQIMGELHHRDMPGPQRSSSRTRRPTAACATGRCAGSRAGS